MYWQEAIDDVNLQYVILKLQVTSSQNILKLQYLVPNLGSEITSSQYIYEPR